MCAYRCEAAQEKQEKENIAKMLEAEIQTSNKLRKKLAVAQSKLDAFQAAHPDWKQPEKVILKKTYQQEDATAIFQA